MSAVQSTQHAATWPTSRHAKCLRRAAHPLVKCQTPPKALAQVSFRAVHLLGVGVRSGRARAAGAPRQCQLCVKVELAVLRVLRAARSKLAEGLALP